MYCHSVRLSGKGETIMDEKEYSVSEAVRLVGVESHVLRYWEEELQVEIRRTAQGHRVYSESNIETFRRVRDLKERGLQLKAIRVLLDGAEGDLTKSTPEEQISGFGNLRENPEEPVEVCEPYRTAFSEIDEQNPDRLRQFEEILKSLIREVVEEQNRKQEQILRELLREEIRQMHYSYEEILQDAMREAAAERESGQEKPGILRSIRRFLGLEKT